MKINIVRTIIMILLLGTFFIIFGFSSQDGEESGNLSSEITRFMLERLPIENNELILKRTESVIRKIAHFSIYALVGFLLMTLISTYPVKENKRILISLGVGILYATSDEIHQAFVPGRSPQITDVVLDTIGVLVGIILLLIIIQICKIIKIKRENVAKNLI